MNPSILRAGWKHADTRGARLQVMLLMMVSGLKIDQKLLPVKESSLTPEAIR